VKFGSPIDFIARRHWPAIGVALAVLACAVVAWKGWLVLADADVLQGQRRGLAALQRQPGTLKPAMSAEDIKRHGQIDALARYLATPWGSLLELFEQHAPTGVVLVKLQPDAATGRIELTGRAPATKAVADYVIALEHDARLSDVLLHHHELLRDDPGAGIEFTVGAGWSGKSPQLAGRADASASSPAPSASEARR
jgi:Tfp pilus assembly protein PilN